jgi:hypothetical protein
VVGKSAPSGVIELVEMARSPEFSAYFAEKGALVSRRFEDMNVALPVHGACSPSPPVVRRAINKLYRIVGRLRRFVRLA